MLESSKLELTVPIVAVLVGSLKRESLNLKLAREIERLAGPRLSFEYLMAGDLPMFNEDLEADCPASVTSFKDAIVKADAVLVVTPEHNRSMPALVKNAVDWGSRPFSNNSWRNKPCSLIGISPSRTGTAVAQSQLRSILVNLGMLPMSAPEAYLVHHDGLFGPDGRLTDPGTQRFLALFIDNFVAWIDRFS
jgi:chromate reductase, NAD(P)H dehydrogenase (quinone)